ncbi:50S ribosomal protein L29 [Candidatus Woesearchaeota archaeon]|nr:50S ribosomal protein L29 [Candidatus Woesearchaeota archaeon]
MKAKELKVMSNLDLENKTIELKKELMKINSQIAIGTIPKSPGKVKQIKQTIAKIFTIKRQKGGSKKE